MSAVADDIWAVLRELAQSQKETDRKFQETDRKFQDTERVIKEMSRETEQKIKEVSASVGRLSNRLGDFIEDAVRPSAARLFQARGIDVHEVHQNIRSQRGGEGIELDLLVVNEGDIVAIECKSKLSCDDVNEHLERLSQLKRLLPAYASNRLIGAMAAMVIEDNAASYAYRKGLYVIGQSGDHLEIRNHSGFIPKIW